MSTKAPTRSEAQAQLDEERRLRAEAGEPADPATEPGPEPEPGEPDDDDEAADDDEATEGGEPASTAGMPSEQQAKSLNRALTTYQRAVFRVLGANAHLQPCPLCDGFGFVPEGVTKPPELAF